jgi:hypothetical protein
MVRITRSGYLSHYGVNESRQASQATDECVYLVLVMCHTVEVTIVAKVVNPLMTCMHMGLLMRHTHRAKIIHAYQSG